MKQIDRNVSSIKESFPRTKLGDGMPINPQVIGEGARIKQPLERPPQTTFAESGFRVKKDYRGHTILDAEGKPIPFNLDDCETERGSIIDENQTNQEGPIQKRGFRYDVYGTGGLDDEEQIVSEIIRRNDG